MTAPLLTTRDRLAEAIHATGPRMLMGGNPTWDALPDEWRTRVYAQVDALFASGAVVDVATLARDETLVERVAAREALSPADGVVWDNRCWELQQHLAALADELNRS